MQEQNQLLSYIEKFYEWALVRNLPTADPARQILKMVEEAEEASSAVQEWEAANCNEEPSFVKMFMDGIGDIVVVLSVIGSQLNVHPTAITNHPGWVDMHNTDLPFKNYHPSAALLGICGKMAGHIARGRTEEAQQWVVKGMLIAAREAKDFEVDFFACLEMAWNEIKDRDGYTFNGVFVKWADLTDMQKGYVEYVRSLPAGMAVSWEQYKDSTPSDGVEETNVELERGERIAQDVADHLQRMGANAGSVPVKLNDGTDAVVLMELSIYQPKPVESAQVVPCASAILEQRAADEKRHPQMQMQSR